MSASSDLNAGRDPFVELLDAARCGDSRALGQLLAGCREYLLLVANKELDQDLQAKMGASDLVQQTLAEIPGRIDQFRGSSREQFLGWLRQALRNDIHDAQRRFKGSLGRQVQRERAMDDPAMQLPPLVDRLATPSSQTLIDEQAQLLKRAMVHLPETYRRVIELRNWSQMSFKEIGEQLGTSPDAARKAWYRAIVKLQQHLGPLLGSTILPGSPSEGPIANEQDSDERFDE